MYTLDQDYHDRCTTEFRIQRRYYKYRTIRLSLHNNEYNCKIFSGRCKRVPVSIQVWNASARRCLFRLLS